MVCAMCFTWVLSKSVPDSSRPCTSSQALSVSGHQGGRKGPFGQPGRHQGGTREAPGRQERTNYELDSLRSTREAPGKQERTNWTACEAPGKQERTNWTAWVAPGRRQGGRKWTAREAAGRHQGGNNRRSAWRRFRGERATGRFALQAIASGYAPDSLKAEFNEIDIPPSTSQRRSKKRRWQRQA